MLFLCIGFVLFGGLSSSRNATFPIHTVKRGVLT